MVAAVGVEEIGTAVSAELGPVDPGGSDSPFHQLVPVGLGHIQEPFRLRLLFQKRPSRKLALERSGHVGLDFVAVGPHIRAQSGRDVFDLPPFRKDPIDRLLHDPCERPLPAGMDRRHDSPFWLRHQDWKTIGGLHGDRDPRPIGDEDVITTLTLSPTGRGGRDVKNLCSMHLIHRDDPFRRGIPPCAKLVADAGYR